MCDTKYMWDSDCDTNLIPISTSCIQIYSSLSHLNSYKIEQLRAKATMSLLLNIVSTIFVTMSVYLFFWDWKLGAAGMEDPERIQENWTASIEG